MKNSLQTKIFILMAACGIAYSSESYISPGQALYVSGNHFVNESGKAVQLRGATLSLLEYSCSPRDRYVSSDFSAMKKWNMNAVKIPINPNFWMGGCDSKYHDAVYQAVKTA